MGRVAWVRVRVRVGVRDAWVRVAWVRVRVRARDARVRVAWVREQSRPQQKG